MEDQRLTGLKYLIKQDHQLTFLDGLLRTMQEAGFEELHNRGERRIWRVVPGRRWHANFKGTLASSKEVVLLHVAS